MAILQRWDVGWDEICTALGIPSEAVVKLVITYRVGKLPTIDVTLFDRDGNLSKMDWKATAEQAVMRVEIVDPHKREK